MRVVLLFSGKLNEWFNANVLQGVCEVLEPEGYDVSPTFVTGRQETERYFAKLPKNRNADAIIIRRSNSTNPHVRNCVSPICRRSV